MSRLREPENTLPPPAPQNMRTFLTIWSGQFVSLIGSSLTTFALGVWIFDQTREATPFALAALLSAIPRIVLAPLAGALVDRWNRRYVLIAADTIAALMTLAGALLYFNDALRIWHIYIIAVVASICGTFQEPAYVASISLMVPKEHLGRANGMIQMSDAVGQLVAPLLAGLAYVSIGLFGVFLIDFVTYFFAIGALMLVRIPQPQRAAGEQPKDRSIWADALYGWRYLSARTGLLGMLLYFALVNFLLNLSFVLNTPLVLSFAPASALGLVQSVTGAGMLLGSILMSAWGGPKRRMAGVCAFIALMAVALVMIGAQASVLTIGVGSFVFLFAVPIASGSNSAIWQSKIEPGVQGRIFATRSMISRSMLPLAFALAGPLADRVFEPLMAPGGAIASTLVGDVLGVGAGRGVGLIYVASGLLLLVVTALAYLNPHIRNIEDELPDAIPSAAAAEEAGEPGGERKTEEVPAALTS